MRYIVHLLPAEAERMAYDAARDRIASVIGPNRAQHYPTAHLTLLWSIQDAPDDPAPIDQQALVAALEQWRGSGAIPLNGQLFTATREHLLLQITDTPALAALREQLQQAVQTIAAAPAGTRQDRAARVQAQDWPHLTLAQEIDPANWETGLAVLQQEFPALLTAPLTGTTLALIARDIAAGHPYQIVAQVPLTPAEH